MANDIVRPKDLAPRAAPVASEIVPSDNGSTVGGVTWEKGVNAGRPLASQAEAEAGTQPTKSMSPLTTKQSIASEAGVSLASKAQGDKADTAVQPGDLAEVATTGSYDDLLDKPTSNSAALAADRSALKAVDTTNIDAVYLMESGREGQFIWRSGDYAARIAADTYEGIYVKADAVAATSGAWVRAFDGPVMADWFGAKPDTSVDNTPRIASALTLAKHVVVPSQGDYRLDGMLQLTGEKTVELRGGVYLRRFAAHSASTDPLVWIRGNGDAFFGVGQRSCGLRTENRHPSGMLRLGQESMSVGTDIVTYANVHDFQFIGMQPHGQTTGQPDICLYMPSPEFSSNANYLHTIRNLSLERANVGLWMQGWANGNIISGLYGYQLGNQTMPTRAAMIICEGGLDNVISSCFFMEGPESTMLVVDTFDNTANGGYVHVPQYNTFTGLVSEQGGSNSKGLDIRSGATSHYEIRTNAGGGNVTFATFYALTNTLNAPDNNIGGVAFGSGYQRSYRGTGAQTIRLYFRSALNGSAIHCGVLKVLFASASEDGAYVSQISEINIPLQGITTWGVNSAQVLSGTAPAVAVVSSSINTLVLTITPAQTSQLVSILASAVAHDGVTLG